MPTAPAKAREEESAASPAIGPDATMADILHAYPTAKIALFIRYHIGGCTSCSYQLTDTLAEVCQNYSIADSFEAVRAVIETYQPLIALHGHIHESRGIAKLGKTVCVNPGSEYSEGVLHGALLEFDGTKGLKRYQLTSG